LALLFSSSSLSSCCLSLVGSSLVLSGTGLTTTRQDTTNDQADLGGQVTTNVTRQ
ncbi:unnamed protein product, partial (mitochondrion) [Musa hybrid cultivar]